MSDLLENERHEKFSLFLAQGFSPIVAYANAGFTPNGQAANALSRRSHIVDRVRVLQKEIDQNLADQDETISTRGDDDTGPDIDDVSEEEAEALVTRKWLLRQLTINITKARKAGQYSASNKAIEMMGNYLGGVFDKKATAQNGATITSVSAEQTADQRANLLAFANALQTIATEPDHEEKS